MRKVLLMLVVLMLVVVGCSTEKKTPTKTVVVEPKAAPAISGAAIVEEIKKVEPVKVEPVKVEPAKIETVKKTVTDKVEAKSTNKLIKVTDKGFVPTELKVKVGDTVEWQNTRIGAIDKMLVIGAQACFDVKSPILESGKSYNYTFTKAETCTIVEAITTTQIGKIIVE